MPQTVTIPKKEYTKMKRQLSIDRKFLREIAQGLMDIKEGRVVRVH